MALLYILLILFNSLFGLPNIAPSIIFVILIWVLLLKFLLLGFSVVLLHFLFHSLSLQLLGCWLVFLRAWVIKSLVRVPIVLPLL